MTTDLQLEKTPIARVPTASASVKAGDASVDVLAKHAPHKPKRTLGLWLVDNLVYTVVNNTAVFAISVAATYLTAKGWPKSASGKPLAEWKESFGNFMRHRGVWMENKFVSVGMTKKQADVSRMVFFSFLDGSLIAPFVKLLEDRREKMAKAIDTVFGTKPKDDKAYIAEPKQSWGSVIEGRLLTSLIVVPTAVAFEKIHFKDGKSVNDYMFEKLSKGLTKTLKEKTSIQKKFPTINISYLSKTAVFEAVYTTICTIGLYVISRGIAKYRGNKKKEHESSIATNGNLKSADPATGERQTAKETIASVPETPQPHVSQTTHELRLAAPLEPQITV